MADLATLKIAVDATQLADATKALNQFVEKAKLAEGEINKLATSQQKQTKTATEAKDASAKLVLTFESQINALKAVQHVMTLDAEVARSAAVQRRLYNSTLASGKSEIDSATIYLAKQVEGLKQNNAMTTALTVAVSGLTDAEKRSIEAKTRHSIATKEVADAIRSELAAGKQIIGAADSHVAAYRKEQEAIKALNAERARQQALIESSIGKQAQSIVSKATIQGYQPAGTDWWEKSLGIDRASQEKLAKEIIAMQGRLNAQMGLSAKGKDLFSPFTVDPQAIKAFAEVEREAKKSIAVQKSEAASLTAFQNLMNKQRNSELSKAYSEAVAMDKHRTAEIKSNQASLTAFQSAMDKQRFGELNKSHAEALRMDKEFNAKRTASQAVEPDVYSQFHIKSYQDRVSGVKMLTAEMARLRAEHAAGNIGGLEYTQTAKALEGAMNQMTHGSSRARGEFRRMASAMASFTFEMTGAIYGVLALTAAIAAPIIPGIKLAKTMEDTSLGIASILISMGKIDGVSIQLPQALAISGEMMTKLVNDSMRFGVSIEALANTLRSTLAPGLAAGMNLDEIQKIATIGTIAVKTIGLDARQTVQEVRDLVAGGIQAASSTLATSLGIKDADVKRWREAGTLYEELMNRMQGFQIAAGENAKTLSGAWEILQTKVALLMNNEDGFNALKKIVIDISNYIGTFNKETNRMEFNPELVKQAKAYWDVLLGVKDVLVAVGSVVLVVSPALIPALQTIAVLISEITFTVTTLFKTMAVGATQLVALAHLDFSGAAGIGADFRKESDAALKAQEENTKKILGLSVISAAAVVNSESSKVKGVAASTEAWAKLYGNQSQKKADAIKKLDEQYAIETRRFADNQEHQISLAKDYMAKLDVINKQFDKQANKAAEKLNKQLEDGRKYYQDYWSEVEKSTEKIIEDAKQIEYETSLIGLSKDAIAAATKEREYEALTKAQSNLETMKANKALPDEIKLQEALINALQRKRAAEEGKVTKEATQAAIEKETKWWADMWKNVDGFAHTAFDNIFDKGKNVFEEIGKAIKKYVLGMLYEMTVKKWIFNIGVAGGGTMGAGAAQAAGGIMGIGGEGSSSWLSAGKSLYEGFSGAFSYSSSATTGMSGMFNSFATSGMGQSLGLSTAGELSLATGEFATSVSQLGSTVGTMGSYLGAGLAGISLGTMIAGDKKVGGLSGRDLSMVGAAIGSFIPVIGTLMGGVIGGLVGAAFGMGQKKAGTTTLSGQFTGAGFGGQYETPWSQKGGWFRSNKSGVDVQGVGAEQQAALNNVIIGTKSVFDNLVAASGDANKSIAGWTFAINRQVSTQEQQNQLIIDMAESMGNYMIPALEQFRLKGENLADTAVRLTDEIIVLNKFYNALGATTRATINSADALATALGGIVNEANLMTSFISTFAPEATQTKLTLESLKNAGLGMAELLTTTEAWWEFSKTASVEQLAVMLSNQGSINAWIQANEKALQAQTDATKALQAHIKALQDKSIADYEAARKATDSLRAFALSVRELQQSLWAGSQTPLSSTYDITRSQFAATNTAAGAGDTNAQGNLASSATAFLDASKKQATSAIEYARDFAMVQNALSDTASTAEITYTVAEAQLTVMELIHQAITEGNAQSYAALLSVQSEINLAKLAGTLDVDTLRGTVTSTTDKQISAVDTMNKSVLRITDPSGALIGASNAIQTEVINNAGYTAKVTDTLTSGTNPILDSMGVWLDSINTQSSIQTQSLAYLLMAAIASSEAAAKATAGQSQSDQLTVQVQAAIQTAQAQAEQAIAQAQAFAAQSIAQIQSQSAAAIAQAQAQMVSAPTAVAASTTIGPTLAMLQKKAALDEWERLLLIERNTTDVGEKYRIASIRADAEIRYRKLPAFAIGTNEVPFDMNARIHAGEEIKPRQFVEKDKSDKKETNELLKKLIVSNDEMKKELVAIKSTNYKIWQIEDKHDIEGLPEVREAA